MTTLKGRLLIGAGLWTAGLVAILGVTLPLFLARRRYGHYPHIVAVVTVPAFAFHTAVLVVLAVAFMVAGLAVVRRAVSPFDRLRSRLAAVRDGFDQRLTGDSPPEVQPLVNDLNALLDHREELVRRALAKAGDLAHGLKTPLAVLSQEAERAGRSGHEDLASTIRQQVDRMRRQVDYHLAHARAAGAGAAIGGRTSVRDSAQGLARTLLQLHADRGITIDVEMPADHFFRGERVDLDEMLGNLLDNACKWAKSRVAVGSSEGNGKLAIVVDDDGPGLDPSMRDAVLQRGVRADEAAPGFGLGLAIVRDLAELYGGSIALDGSPMGGLRARLDLPAV